MYKGTKKAYMTVEASLLLPMILGGIIFIIFLGFYLYNAVTVKQAVYIAALRGSQVKEESRDAIESYVEQELEKMLCNRILSGENMEIKTKVSDHKVHVEMGLVTNISLSQEIDSKINFGTIRSKAEASRINPVDIIRSVRKVNESQISK